jgi:biopolymer transport protein TolR
MHGHIASEDEPMADMNLIPLIDIALTLLIIMMVTTAFVKHPGVSLKLPETATREGAPETKKDLTIVIASTGDTYVDAVKKTPAELQAMLKGVYAQNKESRVLLKGDRDVPYSRIMDVMDMVRQAGLIRVVLPTDPKTPGYGNPATAPASAGTPPVGAPSSAGTAFTNAIGGETPGKQGTTSAGTTSGAPSVPGKKPQ